jgi:flagellar hook-basal body complex protein FliE
MTISAIGAVQGTTASGYVTPAASTTGTASTSGADFSSLLTGAVDNVQQTQASSNQLAIQAVTGDLTDIHAATIAATRAQVTVELVTAVRNKGVDAFNEMMRMQA